MKQSRSTRNQQLTPEPTDGSAAISLLLGQLGAAGFSLGLDDFGILGTHRLPPDWLGATGAVEPD